MQKEKGKVRGGRALLKPTGGMEPDGTMWDGVVAVLPGDPDYDDLLQGAAERAAAGMEVYATPAQVAAEEARRRKA